MADDAAIGKWKQDLLARVDRDTLVRISSDLIDIPSPTGSERECADYILGRYAAAGIKHIPQEFDEGRKNAIGVLKGDGSGPCLMFNGHMDTSYVGDEQYLPETRGYKPKAVVDGDWIYGLGAYNMKCGLAAFLHAVEIVKAAGVKLTGDVILACVAGEIEKSQVDRMQGKLHRGGGCGTWYAITHGAVADFAVVGEPTGLSVMRAHGGYVWTRLTLVGNPKHTVFGVTKDNTINNMMKLAARIQAWGDEYEKRSTAYNMGSKVTLSAIEGGWPHRCSRVPVYTTLYVDTRLMPGQSPIDVQREIEAVVRSLRDSDKDFAKLHFDMNIFMNQWGSSCDPGELIFRATEKAHEEVTGSKPDITAVPYASDAAEMVAHGIPSLNYGPTGRTRVLADHRHYGKAQSDWNPEDGEHASIPDMVTATKTYITLILDLCLKTRDELGIKPRPAETEHRHAH